VAAGLFGLAVAVGLAERLEAAGLTVAIKWPNDLLVDGRKLAGILPRMVHRGSRVRLARVGLGLNVVNAVPPGAIALKQLLPSPRPLPWTAEVLTALERAMDLATVPEAVVEATEARLWARTVNDPSTAELWTVDGLAPDGALRLRQGTRTTSWTRWGDLSSSGL
jgi:BirA family biotin operon repressor/biotin-[acetyl-CoA-carboxylase] ligase